MKVFARRIDKRTHYFTFARNWLPEKTIQESQIAAYAGWVARKEILPSVGTVTDLDAVESFLIGELERFRVRDCSFDPLQSNQIVSHLMKRSGRDDLLIEIAQSAKYMTPGVLELQEIVADGRLKTNSTVLLWCMQNLRVKTVNSSLLQPTRPKDRTQKIDACIALIMALRSCAVKPLDEAKRVPQIWCLDGPPGGR